MKNAVRSAEVECIGLLQWIADNPDACTCRQSAWHNRNCIKAMAQDKIIAYKRAVTAANLERESHQPKKRRYADRFYRTKD